MNIRDELIKEINETDRLRYELWQPETTFVVLGRSQKAEQEVDILQCRAEQIPVLKRKGGGGAVVLMPGVLCITIAFHSEKSDSPYYFFKEINQYIIHLLSRMLIHGVVQEGISDLAIGNKKILGCSMFKSRKHFLYQGSLLVDPDFGKIDRYLLHPGREPAYRQGRNHLQFLTSLRKQGYLITVEDCCAKLHEEMENTLYLLF
jgi:lipoate-protein ligase A